MAKLCFVRLENTDENHDKFYEMTFQSSSQRDRSYDVIVRYGRNGTTGKTIYLRTASGEVKCVSLFEARNAFLKQLKKKFRDKEYTLIDLQVVDKSLEADVTTLQTEFECFMKIAERLEDRGF